MGEMAPRVFKTNLSANFCNKVAILFQPKAENLLLGIWPMIQYFTCLLTSTPICTTGSIWKQVKY